MNNIIKFEVGKTYSMTSVGDHNCVWKYKVIKRTAKTVTLEGDDGAGLKRITEFNGYETVTPLGSYSMSPILAADRMDKEVDEDKDRVVAALKDGVRQEYARLIDSDKVEIVVVKEGKA